MAPTGGPRLLARSALELMGEAMGKIVGEKLAELCDQVADLVEADPGFVVRVARRLAAAQRARLSVAK